MRVRAALTGVVLAALATSTGGALAQSSVWEKVWKSEGAATRVSVVGRARTMALGGERVAVARVRAAGGKVRLDYEAGRRRWSLIDDGQRLLQLDPRDHSVVVHPRPKLAFDQELAERNYEAKSAGETEVAGRRAELIEITPRRGGHVALRLWLDRENGFALRRERYTAEGRLSNETAYEEVEFGTTVAPEVFAVPPGWRQLRPRGEGPRLAVPELGRAVGFPVREPGYVPRGYVLMGGYVQEWGRWGLRLAELRYTDGLRVLSVLQRKAGDEGAGMRGRGGGHGRGRGRGHGPGRGEGRGGGGLFGPRGGEVMTLVDRGTEKALRYLGRERTVVVVGDLSEEELVRVARSVE
jgi:outer membrane lipoprotein-sorting protein